jgi:hypothetical protein
MFIPDPDFLSFPDPGLVDEGGGVRHPVVRGGQSNALPCPPHHHSISPADPWVFILKTTLPLFCSSVFLLYTLICLSYLHLFRFFTLLVLTMLSFMIRIELDPARWGQWLRIQIREANNKNYYISCFEELLPKNSYV